MKALKRYKYGGPETLQLEDIPQTEPSPNEVTIEIHAASVNPIDWHFMRGKPYIMRFISGLFRPKDKIIGADCAGVITKVGSDVDQFSIGDRVYGSSSTGGFAAYRNITASKIAKLPDNVSFEQAGAMPVAGITAFQGIVKHGKVQAGERVLINGASGGVGHFAVQIAKVQGAEVTGVCSTGNVEMVKSLGADHVIDYTQTDIHQYSEQYELVMDCHGNLNMKDFERMTTEQTRGVAIGFTTFWHMFKFLLQMRRANKKGAKIVQFTADSNTRDFATLAALHSEGKIKAVIDRKYPFEQIPEAIAYIEQMHTSGKVVIDYINSEG